MTDPTPQSASRVDTYRRNAAITATDGNEYAGLQINAWRGLHEFVGRRIRELFPKAGRALDLAAGTGAMSLRLVDSGFQVTSTDLVPENFRVHDKVAFKSLDLNAPFADSFDTQFDLVMAVELIEHLENPRHLLRQIHKILAPGGVVIVTTPNVNSVVSKAHFLAFGMMSWFTEVDYEHRGHITPVSRRQLQQIAGEIGYEVVRLETFGDPMDDVRDWRKLRILARMVSLLSTEDPELSKAVLVATLRKAR